MLGSVIPFKFLNPVLAGLLSTICAFARLGALASARPATVLTVAVAISTVAVAISTGAVSALAVAAPAERAPFTVVAIGDVLPGIAYEEGIRAGKDPFRNLKPILTGGDLALANLETPLSDSGAPVGGKKFTFRVPATRAENIKRSGIDVLALGNNHILDYGPDALEDTILALSLNGLLFCGAGANLAEARVPALVSVKGWRVAVLSYNRTFPRKFWATAKRAGTAYALDERVREDVARARATNDVVIVMIHWGRERMHKLRSYQQPLARAAIEAGASLVIGSHPHVAQGVERMGGGVVAYSLGDGVFGGARVRKVDSLVLRAKFGETGLSSVEVFPLQSSNVNTDYAPRIRPVGPKASVTLALVAELSAGLGTVLDPGVSSEGFPCLKLEVPR